MNAIAAMGAETKYQVQDLPNQVLPPQENDCLFVGSGDSYVAGLAAQHISGNLSICCYPTDLIHNPRIASGRNVFFVSISGSTKANILAAKIAKKKRARTIAITTRSDSPLAKECSGLIELKYGSAGVATAGTISFTSSMLACISLTTRVRFPNLEKIYKLADRQADLTAGKIANKGNYFILGNGMLHPIAIYGALKFNEVFGEKAVPYNAEEFFHSPIFGLRKNDQLILLGGDCKSLDERLLQEGFSSVHVDFKNEGIDLLMHSTFFLQLLVLKLAKRRGLTSCYFLRNKKLLMMSSDFIYG